MLVSSVSAWEISLLADTGRISLDRPPEAWIERFLDRPGVDTVPLTWRASARAYRLPNSSGAIRRTGYWLRPPSSLGAPW